ncbi:MAG: hypothetical protein A2312_00935 [Candidatus Staskawiczbacteria bacterium RIFOXYB2_FULL_32_9]|uniref:histidine kinase n=1 Tax=Candidatus Staskawiczbacteria bacterium RIFOXYD1_FULL_32_13 TaxID=1802234 RepID=A0A1G2JQX3_9BACT|nr:MAG: PAS/PAC sensor signal transduction histidine kinase [Parcubacteria group bacterium GW2011_GWC2_32_10]OGZ79686.1 MAG: hypothetical protein A2360_02040 [Candidatus Staskawiczbacteria bacterium RIFOXYB1_FULL_32_11]OGZ84807.1 MAG: hypothetical protein A2312_00935 [Candidatus Staskawiczbacteria bacterium RIFOXYB2_FULL_32_9]OGZ88648.1 MAG: hypothetical protein A2561_02270 [Candidatus Staskawiczbacteria bacterium RIFOXYD1_FULL_32_13]
MDFNYFNISLFVGGLVALIAGIFPYYMHKTKANIVWLFLNISVAIWSFGYFSMISTNQKEIAWISQIIMHFGATFIPVFYLNFVLEITEKINNYKSKLRLIYIWSFLLATLVPTKLYISDVVPKYIFKYVVDAGPLYIYFTLYFWVIAIYAAFILGKTCFEKKGTERLQLIYLFISQIGFLGGGSVFFLTFNISVPPYLLSLFAIYPLLITYAMSRYKLLNIKIVATEFFIFAIWIFLLIRFLLSLNKQDFIVNLIIFASVILFGILLMRNATKEQKQREKIEDYARQVEKAYELEKKSKEELEILDKSKNQFLIAIQHHLRTPLTAMMGYSDLILNGAYGKQSKDTKEAVEKILVSTKNLIKMANEFLDITQFQMGKSVVNLKSNVDVIQILEEIVSELQFETNKKGVYLKLKKIDNLPKIMADREKLKAAIYNIIDNAIKYTTEGEVSIKVKTDENKITIIIEDTGIGISRENLINMFGKTFERGETAKKTFINGRGIGLFITKQIISAHNGKIWAESPGEDKGSTFYIELPIT